MDEGTFLNNRCSFGNEAALCTQRKEHVFQDASVVLRFALRDPVMPPAQCLWLLTRKTSGTGVKLCIIDLTRQRPQARSPKPPLSSIMAMAATAPSMTRVRNLLSNSVSQRASSFQDRSPPMSCLLGSNTQCCGGPDYRSLQKRGFSIFTFDAHSFGKSEPLKPAYLRSYVQSPHHLVDDVYTYVQVRRQLVRHRSLLIPAAKLRLSPLCALNSGA